MIEQLEVGGTYLLQSTEKYSSGNIEEVVIDRITDKCIKFTRQYKEWNIEDEGDKYKTFTWMLIVDFEKDYVIIEKL